MYAAKSAAESPIGMNTSSMRRLLISGAFNAASAAVRTVAAMSGDVDVLGQIDYLDVWNHGRFVHKMAAEPFTDDDAKALSEFGI